MFDFNHVLNNYYDKTIKSVRILHQINEILFFHDKGAPKFHSSSCKNPCATDSLLHHTWYFVHKNTFRGQIRKNLCCKSASEG